MAKDRTIDRHRPGYWAEYKRKWRARKKASAALQAPPTAANPVRQPMRSDE